MADELEVNDSGRSDKVLNKLKDNPAYSAGVGLMALVLIGGIGFVSQNGLPSMGDGDMSGSEGDGSVDFVDDNSFTVRGEVNYESDSVISDFDNREVILKADGDVIGRDTVNADAEGVGSFSLYVAGFKDVRGSDISVELVGWGSSDIGSWENVKSDNPSVGVVSDGTNAQVSIQQVDQAFN